MSEGLCNDERMLEWLRNVALIIIVTGVVSLLWLWATSPLT